MILRRVGEVILGAAALALVVACGDAADSAAIEELRDRVDELEVDTSELEDRLAEAEAALTGAATTTTSTTAMTTSTLAATTSTTLVATTSTVATTTTQQRVVDMRGHVDLVDNRNWGAEGEGCVGRGGYADLSDRFQLTLVSDTGQTLGVVELGLGVPYAAGDLGTDYGATFCRFAFEFPDVPLGSEFYTVASRRGDVVFDREEAVRELALVIGEE